MEKIFSQVFIIEKKPTRAYARARNAAIAITLTQLIDEAGSGTDSRIWSSVKKLRDICFSLSNLTEDRQTK